MKFKKISAELFTHVHVAAILNKVRQSFNFSTNWPFLQLFTNKYPYYFKEGKILVFHLKIPHFGKQFVFVNYMFAGKKLV